MMTAGTTCMSALLWLADPAALDAGASGDVLCRMLHFGAACREVSSRASIFLKMRWECRQM